jgi:hypothetical protein
MANPIPLTNDMKSKVLNNTHLFNMLMRRGSFEKMVPVDQKNLSNLARQIAERLAQGKSEFLLPLGQILPSLKRVALKRNRKNDQWIFEPDSGQRK